MEQWKINFFVYMIENYPNFTIEKVNEKWRMQVEEAIKTRNN